MGSKRDDLIVQAARTLCGDVRPCEKHMGHATRILELFEAYASSNQTTAPEPLWTLAEGDAA